MKRRRWLVAGEDNTDRNAEKDVARTRRKRTKEKQQRKLSSQEGNRGQEGEDIRREERPREREKKRQRHGTEQSEAIIRNTEQKVKWKEKLKERKKRPGLEDKSK